MPQNRIDWGLIADCVPDPLPKGIEPLDDLVRKWRPDLPHDKANSKKRRNWRISFVSLVNFERWKRKYPNRKCENCAHLESNSLYSHLCGIGSEPGGWVQPTKPDKTCQNWKEPK